MSDLAWARHYQAGNLTALFLKGDRQDLEEMRVIEALDKCTCLLIIGITDRRRHEPLDGVQFVSATDKGLVPKHLKGRMWLSAYDKDGNALNGGRLRMDQARARAEFETPHDEYEAA